MTDAERLRKIADGAGKTLAYALIDIADNIDALERENEDFRAAWDCSWEEIAKAAGMGHSTAQADNVRLRRALAEWGEWIAVNSSSGTTIPTDAAAVAMECAFPNPADAS